MDQPSPPRTSFWRFSLRELLLVTLVIGAFLGWGQSLVRRYQDITPTPMAEYFVKGDFGRDATSALKMAGGAAPYDPLQPGTGVAGPTSKTFQMVEELDLPSARSALFVDDLFVRVRKRIVERGCKEYRVPLRTSTLADEGFHLHYRRDTTAGSILVHVVPLNSDRARLIVVLDEHRAP